MSKSLAMEVKNGRESAGLRRGQGDWYARYEGGGKEKEKGKLSRTFQELILKDRSSYWADRDPVEKAIQPSLKKKTVIRLAKCTSSAEEIPLA